MKKNIVFACVASLLALPVRGALEGLTSTLPETSPAVVDSAPVSNRAPLKMSGEVIAKIDRKFFGANLLYWIENKEALAGGGVEALVKELPVTLLRYPGGTVADNFHWAGTSLDNPNLFPFVTPAEAPDMTTFDDFMAFCARTGAEPIVVVNTASWALRDDVEGGAREAADWVRYCKEKNLKVKYWEIGNETYWHPVMTAREYGALARRYSQAMKAVDTGIIVGANGHWDINMSGAKERFPRDQWDSIRKRLLGVSNSAEDKALKEHIEAHTIRPGTRGKEKWWDDVLAECGQHIDMLSVHWYFSKSNVAHIDAKLEELKKHAKAKTGRDYILCMSEYNCNSETEANGWGLAEGLCRMLNTGAALGNFWPMRMKGGLARRALLDYDARKANYPARILKMFSDNFSGDVLKCTSAGKDGLFLFATKSPAQITLVVTARGHDDKSAVEGDYEIAFDADAAKGKVTSVCSFATDKEGVLHRSTPKYMLRGNGMSLHIIPGTFTMIIIKRQ